MDMGIIKFEVNLAEASQAIGEFKQSRMKAFESIALEVKRAVSTGINQLLHAEMALFLGKPEETSNKRNGFKDRQYALKGVGSIRIRMPLDRNRKFKSEIILPREQIDPRLKEDMAVLHLAGLSSRTLAMVSQRLLGVEVSAATVSQSLQVIEDKALEWLSRPLVQPYWALYVDGTNFKIQRRGSTEREPSLVVLGIDATNRMSVLAIEPGTKDNTDAWAAVFSELKRRGLPASDVKIGVMDGLPGLEKLFREHFPNSVTARCWVHALKNALAKTSARLRDAFKHLAHQVMYASGEEEARKAFECLKLAMGADCQRAVQCLEKDLDSLVVHYRFDKSLWRTLRTTNPIERVNKEFKRRAQSMDSMGERTLNILVAFTALRLQFNWNKMPVDSKSLDNLMHLKTNAVNSTVESLLH